MLTGDEVFGLSRTEAEWRKNQYDFTPTVDVQAQPFGKMGALCGIEPRVGIPPGLVRVRTQAGAV